jgi:Na+/H+ antiporter NhaD/arsenite permease-like protein
VLFAWVVVLFTIRLLFREELGQEPKDVSALMKLDARETLSDPPAVRKLIIVLVGTILLFFMHNQLHFLPSFVALLGAAAALLWVRPELEEILKEVEWSVLLFFAGLFVTVGGIEASGLLDRMAVYFVSLASDDLLLLGLLIIWISAILSAIVDNIPFTIVMIPVIQSLGASGLDIGPLWWALALGAGFGGNGTPIGSTANIIAVSISEKTRHPITTRLWLRKGIPVMLVALTAGSLIYALTFRFM